MDSSSLVCSEYFPFDPMFGDANDAAGSSIFPSIQAEANDHDLQQSLFSHDAAGNFCAPPCFSEHQELVPPHIDEIVLAPQALAPPSATAVSQPTVQSSHFVIKDLIIRTVCFNAKTLFCHVI